MEDERDLAALDEQYMAGARGALVDGYRELARHSQDPLVFRHLGVCLAESKQEAAAVIAFERALELDPSDAVSRKRLSLLEARGVRKRKTPGKASSGKASRSFITQEQARQKFLRIFPGGFRDPSYLDRERDYKWAAHQEFSERLNQAAYERFLTDAAHADVCAHLRHIVATHKLNLPATFEIMALNRLLMEQETQELMSHHVFDVTYGRDAAALDRFVVALQGSPYRQTEPFKWPIVSLFPFIARPDHHMFVKPESIQATAARFKIELNYRPLPNSLTYDRVLALTAALREDLADLKPRDNIDLQSFIWVTHSDSYGPRD